MTLVVARNARGTVHVLADTLISGPSADLRKPEHALKIFAPTRNTLICYSGSPELAHAAIAIAWPFLSQEDRDRTIEIISQVEGVEFLLISRDDISRVRHQNVESDLPNAWIGEAAAYSHFREGSQTFEVSPDPSTWSVSRSIEDGRVLKEAFEKVVNDCRHPSVGGPTVIATSGTSGAAYLSYAELTSPKWNPILDDWQTLDFGNAAVGGFGFTTITPASRGITGWGRYYFQALKGFYFYSDPPRNVFVRYDGYAPSAIEFCRAVSAQAGHPTVHCAQLG